MPDQAFFEPSIDTLKLCIPCTLKSGSMEVKFSGVSIQYDDKKNLSNIRKHGSSFSEAEIAIIDPLSIHLYDEAHSESEDRWMAIGNCGGKILVVSFTMRGEEYRIISVRKASKREEAVYCLGHAGEEM